MCIYASLPTYLWDKFYLTASHLHAKTTTHSLKGSTPWELWHERKPDYSYMREIGCRAFVLIPNKNNPKIFERTIECVLIGYEPKSKAYRCYNCNTHKVHSSYHVCFIETHEGHKPLILDPPPLVIAGPVAATGKRLQPNPTATGSNPTSSCSCWTRSDAYNRLWTGCNRLLMRHMSQ